MLVYAEIQNVFFSEKCSVKRDEAVSSVKNGLCREKK